MDVASLTIYSIGHSNHVLDKFLTLLVTHKIQIVTDVRSYPISKYSPQFDRNGLEKALKNVGIDYVFMGKELGGRPSGDQYYDVKGHVLYSKVSNAEFFVSGLARLKDLATKNRLAVLCSEEDPTNCHRRLLIGRVLEKEDVSLLHIRGNGSIQKEEEISDADPRGFEYQQASLFGGFEDLEWKSIQSVLPRKQPQIFSEF